MYLTQNACNNDIHSQQATFFKQWCSLCCMDLQLTEELDIVSFISSLHGQDSALIKSSPFCNPGEGRLLLSIRFFRDI